jgi:hypothetical protein
MINEQCQLKSSNETTECLLLSQLHYLIFKELKKIKLVENKGFEPLTPSLQS